MTGCKNLKGENENAGVILVALQPLLGNNTGDCTKFPLNYRVSNLLWHYQHSPPQLTVLYILFTISYSSILPTSHCISQEVDNNVHVWRLQKSQCSCKLLVRHAKNVTQESKIGCWLQLTGTGHDTHWCGSLHAGSHWSHLELLLFGHMNHHGWKQTQIELNKVELRKQFLVQSKINELYFLFGRMCVLSSCYNDRA